MLLVLLQREKGVSLLSPIRSFSIGLDGSVFPSKLSRLSAPTEKIKHVNLHGIGRTIFKKTHLMSFGFGGPL